MEDRRKNKRLDLNVTLQLKHLDQNGATTVRKVQVKVTDLSKTGIGFIASEQLEIGSYYDTSIQIWTKEIIETVLEIVRNEKVGDEYHYGGTFIGMMDSNALKIDIYRMLEEQGH